MTELRLIVISKTDIYYRDSFDSYKLSKNTISEIKIKFGFGELSLFIKSPTKNFIFFENLFSYRIYKNGKPDFKDIVNSAFNVIYYYFAVLSNQSIEDIYHLCLERLKEENDF